MSGYDPEVVTALRKKYTGLDEELKYIKGHTICNKYDAYKAASAAAAKANKQYKTTGNALEQKKPWSSEVISKEKVKNKIFTPSGHRTMAPLATSSSVAAGL